MNAKAAIVGTGCVTASTTSTSRFTSKPPRITRTTIT
jgi:hypothetical protein